MSDIEEPHDDYHTMSELYYYRMLYNAVACQEWLNEGCLVVKSKRHETGELCFDGEYFIVVAELNTGQVSNHYTLEYWDLFSVPEVELPPKYDGHSPDIAADRIHNWLIQRAKLYSVMQELEEEG